MEEGQQHWPEEVLWSKLAEVECRERIDILYELGSRASQREDFARATTLWQEIGTAALDWGDMALAAESVRLQGNAAFHVGDFDGAVELSQRAAKGHEEAGRTPRHGRGAQIVAWAGTVGSLARPSSQILTPLSKRNGKGAPSLGRLFHFVAGAGFEPATSGL